MTGKFDSDRDAALYEMALNGWSNRSDGENESPTGSFDLINNPDREMDEVVGAFPHFKLIRQELTGYFIMFEYEDGSVVVEEFATAYGAECAYWDLENQYARWLDVCHAESE